MSVAACYLCRAEGKEQTLVITLTDRGEGRRDAASSELKS